MKSPTLEPKETIIGCDSSRQPCVTCQSGHKASHSTPADTGHTDTKKTNGQQLYNMYVPETVSAMQRAKYAQYGSNWTYLAAHMAMGLSDQELGILLRLELDGRNRQSIVSRLIGAIGARMRDDFRQEVLKLFPESSS